MKEFLDNLYKQCAANENGVYALFDVFPALLSQKKFDVVNGLMKDLDLSRIDTSVMYAAINCTCSYIDQLPEYLPLYQRIREEFARRGEPSSRISSLFDRYKDGGDPARKYDPNAPPYVDQDIKSAQRLDDKIAWAESIGDKDLVNYLTFYKAGRLRHDERENKFRNLQKLLGDEEIRRRSIKSLREMADLLEKNSGSWPGIYYCDLPEDPLLKKTFIDGLEVIISYPWPG